MSTQTLALALPLSGLMTLSKLLDPSEPQSPPLLSGYHLIHPTAAVGGRAGIKGAHERQSEPCLVMNGLQSLCIVIQQQPTEVDFGPRLCLGQAGVGAEPVLPGILPHKDVAGMCSTAAAVQLPENFSEAAKSL